MARCGHLAIKSRSPGAERSAAQALMQTACAFSPNVEATAPGVCTLEMRGLGFAGDDARVSWMLRMLDTLAQLHLRAQTGLAPTPALALLAARAAQPALIARDPARFVAALPIAALEPPEEIRQVLDLWGIRSVGQLLALGREAVAARLGAEAAALFERVSPDNTRPLKLVAPPEEFEEQTEFEAEIETVEPLLFVLRRFVEQLSRRIDALHLAAAELHLRLGLASGAAVERAFKIPAPTTEVETLFRMLRTYLETVRTDSAIRSLRLRALPCLPQQQQFGLFECALRDPNQFAETLARLTGLCGSDRVGTPRPEATHRPDAFTLKPPEFGSRLPRPRRGRARRRTACNCAASALPCRPMWNIVNNVPSCCAAPFSTA